MPHCRQCKKYFPVKAKIEGRQRNLQNRKFCLECSPFGDHNTNAKTPGVKARVTSQEREARRKKNQSDSNRAKRFKHELVQIHGGKCSRCGYNRCIKALHFHHRNPETKLFELDKRSICSKSWDSVQAEADKCDLLCANCHTEVHEEISEMGFEPHNLQLV